MKRIFCQGWEWNFLRISLLIAPILPVVAGLGIISVLIATSRKEWKSIVASRLNRAIGVLSLWLLFVAILSPRPIEGLLGLANYLPYFYFFVNIRQIVEKPSQLRELAWVLVIPSVWVVAMGLGQIFLGWGNIPFTGWSYVPYGDPAGRMSSVFMYANLLGVYLLMILILAIGLWIATFRSWKDNRSRKVSLQLGFLTFAVAFDSLGLFLTNSRSAWGFGFLAALLFALYLGWRSIVAGFAAVAGAISIASWGPVPLRDVFRSIVPRMIWARFSDELYPDRPVATLRATQWRFAWEMVQERPIIGWGLRNFSKMYKASTGIWVGHAHNLYLMLMAETGIVGLLMFCAWVAWIYGRGIRLYRFLADKKAGGELMLFTYLVAFGGCILFNFFDVTLNEPKVNTTAWLIFASIAGIVRSADRKGIREGDR